MMVDRRRIKQIMLMMIAIVNVDDDGEEDLSLFDNVENRLNDQSLNIF